MEQFKEGLATEQGHAKRISWWNRLIIEDIVVRTQLEMSLVCYNSSAPTPQA